MSEERRSTDTTIEAPIGLVMAALLAITLLGMEAPLATMVRGAEPPAAPQQRPRVLDLWADGTATFGVFAPDERPQRTRGEAPLYTVAGGALLGANELYDFVFLNLERRYDGAAVAAIVEGMRSTEAGRGMALLVRIPPIESAGADATRARVAEILAAGADGVVFPHVRSPAEAALAVSLLTEAGVAPWSAANPSGNKIAMIMIEDPESLARVAETAEVAGISVLACGIGSLRGALGGDREAAEAGNQKVLAEAQRIGAADMITANATDIEQRVSEGFLALLLQVSGADEAIRIGRAAARR